MLNALPAILRYESVAPEYAVRIDHVMTPHGIASRDLRTTVYDEYLPRSANPAELQPSGGLRTFNRWAFPVWRVTREGNSLQPAIGPGGVVAVRTESDNDELDLALRDPTVRSIGKGMSVLAAGGIALFAVVQVWRRKARRIAPA
ncbi:MAG TPA: hypothetical protein VK993_15950 [Chthoniobacterales bacterium]|nr:hypothetical protein [Chthoniobacterales bacterium]